MPKPDFDTRGLLLPGIHDCSLNELYERFGRYGPTTQRQELFAKFEQSLQEARTSTIVSAILVDGSFVTAIVSPNDIDMIAVLAQDHDFSLTLRPYQANVISNCWVRSKYGFDLLVARKASIEFEEYTAFFQQVRGRPERRKGLLRLKL